MIETADVEIFSEDIPGWLVANEGKLTVALEVTVTEELRREMCIRDRIRNLQIEDYDQLAQSFTRVYSDGSDVVWTHKQREKLIRIFPEGQIVTVVDEKIVGCALSIIVNYDDVKNDHKMCIRDR